MSNRLYSRGAEIHYSKKEGFFSSFLYLLSGTYLFLIKPALKRATNSSQLEDKAISSSHGLDAETGRRTTDYYRAD